MLAFFTVAFDQLYASLLNIYIFFILTDPKLLNGNLH